MHSQASGVRTQRSDCERCPLCSRPEPNSADQTPTHSYLKHTRCPSHAVHRNIDQSDRVWSRLKAFAHWKPTFKSIFVTDVFVLSQSAEMTLVTSLYLSAGRSVLQRDPQRCFLPCSICLILICHKNQYKRQLLQIFIMSSVCEGLNSKSSYRKSVTERKQENCILKCVLIWLKWHWCDEKRQERTESESDIISM